MAWKGISSPSFWLKVLSLLALVGIVLLCLGAAAQSKPLVIIGLALGAPLVLAAVFAILVGTPVAIWTRRKEADK